MHNIQDQNYGVPEAVPDSTWNVVRSADPTPEARTPGHTPGLFFWEQPHRAQWQVVANLPVQYQITVTNGLLETSNPALGRAGATGTDVASRRLLVMDHQVHSLYADLVERYFRAQGVAFEFEVIEGNEPGKTMDAVFQVARAMDRFGILRRSDPVIAIGGGVLTDIVGLAASLYRRSTPYVRVPTTLMGMIDAGIGVKTGVNFMTHKNRLGTYYAPAATLVDPCFLFTSDRRHLCNGLAEALKMALIKDAALFDLLEAHGARLVQERLQAEASMDGGEAAGQVLRRSIHGMLEELQPNLWEHRLDRLVDYGHTFSPGIEMHALPELLHGEAVAIDMALCLALAHSRGLLPLGDLRRVLAVMRELALPIWHPVCTVHLLLQALADSTKHRNGRQLIPLTKGIGQACFVNDISAAEVEAALHFIAAESGQLESSLREDRDA